MILSAICHLPFSLILFFLALPGGGAWVGVIPPWPFAVLQQLAATAWMFRQFGLLADLPAPTSSQFWVWLLCAGLVVFLLSSLFWGWNQAKEALGRKPDTDEEIEALKKAMVTHSALEQRLSALATDIERKFERALHEEFKQLNGERSRSIAGLHEKVEETTKELRTELGERITIVDGLVREMQGQLKEFFRRTKQ
jgi:hypothetical protein